MIDSSRLQIEEEHKEIYFPFTEDLKEECSFQIKDLCVFIDPLDCTRGFINNKKWECTILIGVTYKKRPILGVIAQPYVKT